MKKSIFAVAAALCLLVGSDAFAKKQNLQGQTMPKERPTAEQMAQRRTERMTKELGLNEKQAKEVYTINLQQVQQMQAMREQMRKNRSAEAEKMKSVLTTDQFVKWSQMQGPKPGAHRGKMGKDGKPGCCAQTKGECKGQGNKNCAKQRASQANK